MQGSFLGQRAKRASASIIAIVMLLGVFAAGAAGWFVYWSTSNNDTRSLQRDIGLVSHFIQGDLVTMVANQESAVVWDDAYANTVEQFDRGWVDQTLGAPFYNDHSYEQAFVLDGDNVPVYAMQQGNEVKPPRLGSTAAPVAPLIEQVRARIARGDLEAYFAGAIDTLPSAADIVSIAGMPAQVSVVPITSGTGAELGSTAPTFLHVAVEFLDTQYADFLSGQYLLDQGEFTANPVNDTAKASLPILDKAGRIVTFFQWRPDQPGRRMLGDILPALALAVVIAMAVIGTLLHRLYTYSAALEAGRAEAQRRAFHDVLTGLPNRAFFEETLDRCATGTNGFTLMMLDLDRFKQVNDSLGHPAGDELIRAVGARLSATLSSTGMVARLGGDEFAVLDRAMTVPGDAMALASRIIEVLGAPFTLFGNQASIGVSIGMVLTQPGIAATELVRRADIALYEAKANGRNCAARYQESMDEGVRLRHAIEADLRQAMADPGQLYPVYEPIIDVATGAVLGAEVTPRWVHPHKGVVAPAEFLHVAEAAGLIEKLNEDLLRRAASLAANWYDKVLALEFTAAQLRNPRCFEHVFGILADTGLRPGGFQIDVPAGVIANLSDTGRNTLRKFRTAGVRVAATGLGSGYSALSTLDAGHCDVIKLDATGLSAKAETRSVLQALAGLVQAMGMSLGAHKVTSEDQHALLAAIGCRAMQGPYLHMELKGHEAQALLTANRTGMHVVASRVA